MQKSAEDRFWAKVNKNGECWIWTGAKLPKGYGHFYSGEKTVLASRWSYEYAYGLIPEGLMVLHRCDNPPCVNPEHLFLGTMQDNIDDMIAKGRQRKYPPKPERVVHPRTVRTKPERVIHVKVWKADKFYDADPEGWRRQVLENIAAEKAKNANQYPVRRGRVKRNRT